MNTDVLKRIGFKPSAHNEIFYDHLEIITDFLKEHCPIEKKKALSMLRGSTGISNRYVKEHIDSLLAWDVIRSHSGNFEWVLDGVPIPSMKNENVPDTFHGDIGTIEIKPCSLRNDHKMTCSVNGFHIRKTTVEQCNSCGNRQEPKDNYI